MADAREFGEPEPISESVVEDQKKFLRSFMNHDHYERFAVIREELGATLGENVGIYREEPRLKKGLEEVLALRDRFKKVRVHDTGDIFNTNLVQVLELRNMLDLAVTVAKGALLRQESRGSHHRVDYPTRNDAEWHKHTMYTLKGDGVEIGFKPVTMGKYELQERKY